VSKEVIILASVYIIITLMLIIFVPKNKIREATLIFFFKQLLTWMLGLIVVQYGLIEYPIRSFPKATSTSFDFEYFFYPAICVVFNLYYPADKSKFRIFMHYVYFCSVMSFIEAIVEKYTEILTYIHWSWYITWISLFITFYASRKFYVWYFKLKTETSK
jgi:hypothetical protein